MPAFRDFWAMGSPTPPPEAWLMAKNIHITKIQFYCQQQTPTTKSKAIMDQCLNMSQIREPTHPCIWRNPTNLVSCTRYSCIFFDATFLPFPWQDGWEASSSSSSSSRSDTSSSPWLPSSSSLTKQREVQQSSGGGMGKVFGASHHVEVAPHSVLQHNSTIQLPPLPWAQYTLQWESR